MKFILKINGTESPKAAYVGWTPAKCTLEIEDHPGEAQIPVTIATGHDDLEGRISLYESNATTSEPVDKIEYDFQTGDKVTFYVAGKYPNASVGKKDTLVRVESNANQVPALTTKVMVRVRKNANYLKALEIEKFLRSFVALGGKSPRETYPGQFTVKPKNLLDEIVLMHTYDAAREIHGRTSFHPWHRAFLSQLERELQEEDQTVTIPYWRFDLPAENVFTENFIGKTDQRLSSTPLPAPTFDIQNNPLYSYRTTWGPLTRAYWVYDPAVRKPLDEIYDQSAILSETIVPDVYPRTEGEDTEDVSSKRFLGWAFFEENESHNPAHGAFDGLVADIGKDPTDPLFFMMHGNVDRLWALWQRKYDRLTPTDMDTYPFQGKHPGHSGPVRWPNNEDKGNLLKDTLWPWDLDDDPIRPPRSWNSANPNVGTGIVPKVKLSFPDSPTTTAPGLTPTVESMIDYQGRLNGGIALGFDYDTIPYFDRDLITFDDQVMFSVEEQNARFLNPSLPVGDRLNAALNARLRKQEEVAAVLEIIRQKDEDERIRIQSVRLADKTREQFLDVGIEVINDDSAPAALRSELIHFVSNAKRSNKHFPSRQPGFFNALRGLIRSDIPSLRSQSIGILSANEDETVQEFLVEELKKDQSAFISQKDAIAFLTQNPKPQHANLFLETFEQSDDEEVRTAAIKGLGNDPESVDLLKKVILDDGESFKVREAGALSLHHIDQEAMNDLAVQVIAAPDAEGRKMFFTSLTPNPDEVDFKAGLLNMLTFTGDINRMKHDEGLKNSLEQVTDPGVDNKSSFRGSLEMMSDTASEGPTVIEQMAAKLLNKLEAIDEDE